MKGIESLARRSGRVPLGRAWPLAQQIIEALKRVPGVRAAEPAGSLRRMRPTVGDLDILVAAADSAPVMEAFTTLPGVMRVLGSGETKSSIEFADGVRAQVWVHPPEKFGTALQYATGSKDHNVQLRQLALDKGLSLSEHALTRIDGSGEILCATEEEVYAALGLPWIPPELREDRGEVQAAKAGKLPRLIEVGGHPGGPADAFHVVGRQALHARDGAGRGAARDQGHCLHGPLGQPRHDRRPEHGTPRRAAGGDRAGPQGAGGQHPVLHASEVEIKADGTLDYPDEFLATLDLVVASLHSSLGQERDKVTRRLINAIRNPHVDIIGHPTGRLIPDRPGADLDMDAVLAAAADTGVALEINASPFRLDLEDVYARRARDMGILLSINTDAHSEADLDMLPFGVAIARRAWLTAGDVINTWPTEKLLEWLGRRGK